MKALSTLAGKFIVIDGNEGCGKTTQLQLLAAACRAALSFPVITVRDPGATPIGEKIRAILLDTESQEMGMRCEMLLYMAARAQMMHQIILPSLRQGHLVLCDRFVSSTLAYQAGGDGLTEAEITATGNVAIHSRWPDLTCILDMPPERAFERLRRQRDRIELRPLSYHQSVHARFIQQTRNNPDRVIAINADQTPEQVHADLVLAIESHFADAGNSSSASASR